MSDAWQIYGTMPSANGYSASTYAENFGLVIVGGNNDESEAVVTKDGYAFKTLASPPFSTGGGCLAVIDEQTLLLTGDGVDAASYDILSDSWTR